MTANEDRGEITITPPSSGEGAEDPKTLWVENERVQGLAGRDMKLPFVCSTFDRVYGMNCTQRQIYDHTAAQIVGEECHLRLVLPVARLSALHAAHRVQIVYWRASMVPFSLMGRCVGVPRAFGVTSWLATPLPRGFRRALENPTRWREWPTRPRCEESSLRRTNTSSITVRAQNAVFSVTVRV